MEKSIVQRVILFCLLFKPLFSTQLFALLKSSHHSQFGKHNQTKPLVKMSVRLEERDDADSPNYTTPETTTATILPPTHNPPFVTPTLDPTQKGPRDFCLLTKLNTCEKERVQEKCGGRTDMRRQLSAHSTYSILPKTGSSSYVHIMSHVCSCGWCVSMLKNASSSMVRLFFAAAPQKLDGGQIAHTLTPLCTKCTLMVSSILSVIILISWSFF